MPLAPVDDGKGLSVGSKRGNLFTYTGPSSYATGGDSKAASDFGLGRLLFLDFAGVAYSSAAGATRLVVYSRTTGKFLWFVPNTGAEVAAATDLSGYSLSVLAVGG